MSGLDEPVTPRRSLPTHVLWWLKLGQVRFRFLIVILLAAGIVSQWTTLQSLWDRTIWNSLSMGSEQTVSGAHEFFCPMDPGVLSTWPAICPICNMDLVPRRKTEAQLLPEGVVARMQFTPYRIQLAGIRVATVETKDLCYELSFTGVLKTMISQESDKSRVGLEVFPSVRDAALLVQTRQATMTTFEASGTQYSATIQSNTAEPSAGSGRANTWILPDDPDAIPVGSAVTAVIAIPALDVLAADGGEISETALVEATENPILFVPESSVIDRGTERLVYVESMPGMFDGTVVTVGRRFGAFYPVLSGLSAGQRVATAGAFLIDAESRLNPSLAAGYFGANSSAMTSSSATSPLAPVRKTAAAVVLSAEDQSLVAQQKICPVTGLSLNSMGGPIPVMLGDRRVFICCAGCERRLRDEPEKYLAKIPPSP